MAAAAAPLTLPGDAAKASWTASFAKAQRAQEQRQPGDASDGSARDYSAGNNNSEAIFKKIAASHAETQRLREQCREAAAKSAARRPEERVKLDHVQKSIDAAVAVGSYSRSLNAIQPERLGDPASVPGHLGHLLLPEPTLLTLAPPPPEVEQKEAEQAMELTLPGAVEPLPIEGSTAEEGAGSSPHQCQNGGGASGEAAQDAQHVLRPHSSPDEELDGFGEDDVTEFVRPKSIVEEAPPPPPPPPPPLSAGGGASRGGSASRGGTASRGGSRGGSFIGEGSGIGGLGSDGSEEDSETANWPPKPPFLRFKMLCQFSSRFKPSDESRALFYGMTKTNTFVFDETANSHELQDMTVGWFNKVFETNITTEFQFEVTFPIMLLTMLDAIYARRVKWREIDFRYQYKHALQKNFAVLERIWLEVNMEKAREFRVESTSLRMENMLTSSSQEKLAFLRVMKRWYDQRRHHADPYDPLEKRREIINQCKTWGITVKFPPWINFDKEEPETKPNKHITDTWRVRSKVPINILATEGGDATVVGQKRFGESFRGYLDGDWVCLVDEPGYIRRVKLDTREKFVEKQDKCRVVCKAPVPVRSSRSELSTALCEKLHGDFVFGYQDGDWVELVGEPGYMSMFTGKHERALQVCSPEEYSKMPEYKRLIWFLGSTEHQTM